MLNIKRFLMDWAYPSIPLTPKRKSQRPSLEVSPFDKFCMSSLSPLQSAKKTGSPMPRSLSPQVLWPTDLESETMKQSQNRVIKKIDFSETCENYEFKARSVSVYIHVLPEENPVQEKSISLEPKKLSCSCLRSKCLKFYCDCFSNNTYCVDCNCIGCMNKPENEVIRKAAYESAIEKKLLLSQAKKSSDSPRGCSCKRSACTKKYCECFLSNKKCSNICKCHGCKNN